MIRAAISAAALLCAACVTVHPNPSSALSGDAEWERQFSYLSALTRGGRFLQWEFDAAISYMEEQTGVDSGLVKTHYGVVLDTEKLALALRVWEKRRPRGQEAVRRGDGAT